MSLCNKPARSRLHQHGSYATRAHRRMGSFGQDKGAKECANWPAKDVRQSNSGNLRSLPSTPDEPLDPVEGFVDRFLGHAEGQAHVALTRRPKGDPGGGRHAGFSQQALAEGS